MIEVHKTQSSRWSMLWNPFPIAQQCIPGIIPFHQRRRVQNPPCLFYPPPCFHFVYSIPNPNMNESRREHQRYATKFKSLPTHSSFHPDSSLPSLQHISSGTNQSTSNSADIDQASLDSSITRLLHNTSRRSRASPSSCRRSMNDRSDSRLLNSAIGSDQRRSSDGVDLTSETLSSWHRSH